MMREFVVTADHFQVLVGDRERGPLVDTWDLWQHSATHRCVGAARALLAVPTVRYGGEVQVAVELVATRSEAEVGGWDSLGDFELDVSAGELLLWGPELSDLDQGVRTEVPNGSYAGEVFSRDTDQVVDEEATAGPDRYRIVLWPTTPPFRAGALR